MGKFRANGRLARAMDGVAMLTNFRPLHGTPKEAAALGVSGAIPFVALAVVAALADGDTAVAAKEALRGYGIAILAFLGGIHWGLAMAAAKGTASGRPDTRQLVLSVVPSLYAWACLALPLGAGLIVLAAGFPLFLLAEAPRARAGEMPAWYLNLRGPLTATATVSLVLGGLL